MRTKPIIQRSVVFTKPQMVWLEKESEKLGISISDLIRRAIDEVRTKRG